MLDPRLPRLPSTPVFGNLLEFRKDRIAVLTNVAKLGPVSVLRLGPREVVSLTEPELIQTVLIDRAYDFHKGINYKFLAELLEKGLVTSEDELHKRQRRLVAPALSHARIAAYADTMASNADRHLAAWPDGGVVDVAEEMMGLTLDIVAATLFHTEIAADARAIGDAFTVGNRWVADEAARLFHVPVSLPLPRMVRLRRARASLHATVDRFIAERRASGRDEGDVLSMLLLSRDEDGSGMDDAQVRDEAITMLFAGHETTANAMAWTALLLTRHPDVLARLQREVDAALGGRVPGLADLASMPLCLQVFKESMRLFPPVPAIARRAMREVKLGEWVIEPGQVVMINIWGLHHRESLFPAPEEFDPARFTPEREKKLPRHAYLPFATGPRVCIGNHFALMEGQLLLAHLVQRFDFSLEPGQRIEMEPIVTLRPKYGVKLRVRRRAPDQRAGSIPPS